MITIIHFKVLIIMQKFLLFLTIFTAYSTHCSSFFNKFSNSGIASCGNSLKQIPVRDWFKSFNIPNKNQCLNSLITAIGTRSTLSFIKGKTKQLSRFSDYINHTIDIASGALHENPWDWEVNTLLNTLSDSYHLRSTTSQSRLIKGTALISIGKIITFGGMMHLLKGLHVENDTLRTRISGALAVAFVKIVEKIHDWKVKPQTINLKDLEKQGAQGINNLQKNLESFKKLKAGNIDLNSILTDSNQKIFDEGPSFDKNLQQNFEINKQLKDELIQVKGDFLKLKETLAGYEKAKNEAVNRKVASDKEITTLRTHLQGLKNEYGNKLLILKAAQDSLDELNKKIVNLQEENQKLNNQAVNLNATLKKTKFSSQDDDKILIQNLHALRNEETKKVLSLEKKCNELEKNIIKMAALEEENKKLKEKPTDYTEKVAELSKKQADTVNDLSKKIADLEKQIEELKKQNAQLSLASHIKETTEKENALPSKKNSTKSKKRLQTANFYK